MGNKICFHPRVILTDDLALHFKSSNLVRDVMPIIEKWRLDGAELCLNQAEFKTTFDVVVETEKQFRVFDVEGNGRIDAHQILMVYILLSSGEVSKKVDTVFSTFEFAGSQGDQGNITFDEAMIVIEACVNGLQKVCHVDFHIPDDEIFFHCKSLFDMHHVPHSGRISRKQFTAWCTGDAAPRAFVNLFHDAQGLPDIYALVQQVNLQQSQVFQMLAHGQLHVSSDVLVASAEFRRTLKDPSEFELEALVNLMEDRRGRVTTDAYHSVLRPWNIFNECDIDGSGELDDKEMEILLWIQLRKKPDQAFAREFVEFIDDDRNGTICRAEWVHAIVQSHEGTNLAKGAGPRKSIRQSLAIADARAAAGLAPAALARGGS